MIMSNASIAVARINDALLKARLTAVIKEYKLLSPQL